MIPKAVTDNPKKEPELTHKVVMEITSDIVGDERNVTGDRFFSSVQTVVELLKKKMTYVGTMVSNRYHAHKT